MLSLDFPQYPTGVHFLYSKNDVQSLNLCSRGKVCIYPVRTVLDVNFGVWTNGWHFQMNPKGKDKQNQLPSVSFRWSSLQRMWSQSDCIFHVPCISTSPSPAVLVSLWLVYRELIAASLQCSADADVLKSFGLPWISDSNHLSRISS